MNMDRYLTLDSEGHGQLREKASRFIAWAFPIRDEDDFKERLKIIAKEHHASRQVCYAWVLGEQGERHRSNDAGEPNGTAGRPVLQRIRSMDLTQCAVVVVRYFGGTLLGKAGLVRAYGEAAALALAEAIIVERVIRDTVIITCGYAEFGSVRDAVLTQDGEILESELGEQCRITVAIPKSQVARRIDLWAAQGIEARRIDHIK